MEKIQHQSMSRIEKQNSEYTLAYGVDHAIGIFIQVFNRSDVDGDEPVVDMDAFSNRGLTPEKIVAIAEEYGFDISHELPEKIIE